MNDSRFTIHDSPILVTGAAGFIGSKVSEKLLEQGVRVIGIDNLNDAYDVTLKKWRLDNLQKSDRFNFHRMDICDQDSMSQFFSAQGPFEAVINLAARAGVRPSVPFPHIYYETNVLGTLNLLECCREQKIKKFILASTSSVYGDASSPPFREDANTDQPLSPYAASKKGAEALCHVYSSFHKMDITVLRYFTVYGPAGRPDMSPLRFVKWIREGEPLILYGDGKQQRDFTFIDDIASGTLAGLKTTGFEIINLGTDRTISINNLIALLEKKIDKRAHVKQLPRQSCDMPSTQADITKAGQILEWKPMVTLEDGFEKLIDWYEQNREWAKDISLDG